MGTAKHYGTLTSIAIHTLPALDDQQYWWILLSAAEDTITCGRDLTTFQPPIAISLWYDTAVSVLPMNLAMEMWKTVDAYVYDYLGIATVACRTSTSIGLFTFHLGGPEAAAITISIVWLTLSHPTQKPSKFRMKRSAVRFWLVVTSIRITVIWTGPS